MQMELQTFLAVVLMDGARLLITLLVITAIFKACLWMVRFWVKGFSGLLKK